MAFGKFFALFFISLAVFAPTEAASVRAALPEMIGEAITSVTNILKELIQLLEDLVDKVADNPDSVENSLINVVNEILVFVEDNLDSKVQALGDSLDTDGLTLYNCFVTNRDDSNQRLLSFFTEFFSCANPSMVKVIEKVDPILEVLRTADTNCAAVADDVAKCGETDFSCFITSVISILNEIIAIPDNMKQPIADIKEEAAAVADTLADCATKGSDEWYTEFIEGLGDLNKCSSGSRK